MASHQKIGIAAQNKNDILYLFATGCALLLVINTGGTDQWPSYLMRKNGCASISACNARNAVAFGSIAHSVVTSLARNAVANGIGIITPT
jgi:hypothetical protein